MLNINMLSTADKVKGQGVGSAYLELISMLNKHFPKEFNIEINKHSKSQITHYHTINLSYYFSTFLSKRGRKIGYVHFLPETLEGSLKLPKLIKWIFYKYVIAFYKRMDHIVVVNPTFIPKLEKYGISKNDITYIPNFVSKEEFYPLSDEKKSHIRKNMGFKDDDFIVVGTGQVQTRKGVLDFAKLAQSNPDVQFIWAGGFSFGKITDGYKQLKLLVDNPPKNLYFPGIVDRDVIFKYYNIANLFLLPSYNELFPMSVLEAFSCGTPVMLRHLDLYKKIIEGYYVPFDNFAEMDANLKSLKNNPDTLKKLSDKSIRASAWWWILVAFICMALYLGLEAVITKIIVNTQSKRFTFKDALRVPLVEQLFNGITPFSSGGQPGQLYVLVQTGVDAGKASSTLLMKFIIFQGMIVLNFIISLIVGFQYIEEKLHYLAIFVIFGFVIHLFVIAILILIMYWYSFTKKMINIVIKPLRFFISNDKFINFKSMIDEKVDNFHQESVKIAKQWKLMFKIIIITFFQLAFYYLIPYFIMLSLGFSKVNIIVVVSLHVLIFMIISLFPIPGGAGGAEYSFEALFKSYITNSTKLVLALMIWRLLTYYLGMILGAIALFIKPDKISKK